MRIKPLRSLAALLVLAAVPSWSAGPDAVSMLDNIEASAAGVFTGFSTSRAPKAPATQPGAPARNPKAPAKKLPTLPGTPSKPPTTPPSQPGNGGNGRVQPDWAYTPGRLCQASDPDFKEYRYAEHIPYCNRNVTQQMKLEISAHYGISQADWPKYEFDHLIPLAAGGNSHVDNLWPQPRGANGSDDKDKLETQLYNELQAGTKTQAEAVREIYAWFGAGAPTP